MAIICISLAVLSGVYIGHKTEYIVTETWEQKGSYRNGYILNFVLSIRDCFIAAPGGYSSEAVKALEEAVFRAGIAAGRSRERKTLPRHMRMWRLIREKSRPLSWS